MNFRNVIIEQKKQAPGEHTQYDSIWFKFKKRTLFRDTGICGKTLKQVFED